jgi:PTS system nitrogen regulatory IIA component
MKLSSFLPRTGVVPHLGAQNSEQVLQELSIALCQADPSLKVDQVRSVLEEREKLGSTGIGSGVAIPHGKLASAKKIVACFGRSEKGLEFQSQDGEPAYLFFALIAPENAAGLHLKVLAKLSRLLKDRSFRDRLMKAKDADEIYEILSTEDEKM